MTKLAVLGSYEFTLPYMLLTSLELAYLDPEPLVEADTYGSVVAILCFYFDLLGLFEFLLFISTSSSSSSSATDSESTSTSLGRSLKRLQHAELTYIRKTMRTTIARIPRAV